MDSLYDAGYMRSFYDAYGTREWDRLESDPTALVNFHIHRLYLERFIPPGDRVLDAGAGPGCLTIELARLGATITVGDLSPVQLGLNRQKVREAGLWRICSTTPGAIPVGRQDRRAVAPAWAGRPVSGDGYQPPFNTPR
jgi:SAM-dependent methyltransferase